MTPEDLRQLYKRETGDYPIQVNEIVEDRDREEMQKYLDWVEEKVRVQNNKIEELRSDLIHANGLLSGLYH